MNDSEINQEYRNKQLNETNFNSTHSLMKIIEYNYESYIQECNKKVHLGQEEAFEAYKKRKT